MQRYARLGLLVALCWSCSSEDPVEPSGRGGSSVSGATSASGTSIGADAGSSFAGVPQGTAGSVTAGRAGTAGSAGAAGDFFDGGGGGGGGSGTSSGAGGSGGSSTAGAAGRGGSGGSIGGSLGGSTATDPGTEGDGDITIGPNYTKHPDLSPKATAGRQFSFTMNSSASKVFNGLDKTLNSPQAFTRKITVHIPAKYKDGTAAPFMVVQDGANFRYNGVRTAMDNLSQSTNAARRVPPFIVIAVANGGGDSFGSERGLEYDTMSDRYARLIDEEVLPAVKADAAIKAAYPNLKFTDDPDGRGTVGCSSGGSAAVIMGWFKPDRFRRVIAYSATLVAQQDSDAPEKAMYPHGAWDFHSDLELIAKSDAKPLRIFINANDADNGAGQGAGNRHDWLLANQRTAAALKAKNYHYRFLEGKSAGHCDEKVFDASIPDTLVWIWRGYPTGT